MSTQCDRSRSPKRQRDLDEVSSDNTEECNSENRSVLAGTEALPGNIEEARKQVDSNYEVQCSYSNSSVTVKNFMQSIGFVLQEGHFTITKTDEFEGISTFSMDASHVALVQGRLSADVLGEVTPENSSFCVNMSCLNECLKCAHAQHFLDINRVKGNTDVIIAIHEPDNNTYAPCFKLKTLAKNPEPIDLPAMDYMLQVEVGLQEFKNAIKTAKVHGSDTVTFEILQLKNQVGPVKDAFFVIGYEADVVCAEFVFSSETNDDENSNGRIVIRACEKQANKNGAGSPSRDQCNVLYYGKYLVEYLFLFVKGMERSSINIYLGNDKPLVLHYPLGCTNSDYIRYLLAQKIESTEA